MDVYGIHISIMLCGVGSTFNIVNFCSIQWYDFPIVGSTPMKNRIMEFVQSCNNSNIIIIVPSAA